METIISDEDFYKKIEELINKEKSYKCPNCGALTDGKTSHISGSHYGRRCYTVIGRKGWRELGEYDS